MRLKLIEAPLVTDTKVLTAHIPIELAEKVAIDGPRCEWFRRSPPVPAGFVDFRASAKGSVSSIRARCDAF